MITALFTFFSVIVFLLLVALLYYVYKLNTSDGNFELIIDGLVLALLIGIVVVIVLANLMIFI